MIKHYRKAHPDDGIGCWDQLGSFGDPFVDSAMTVAFSIARSNREENKLLKNKLKLIADLLTER